jgi:hypothetical protein
MKAILAFTLRAAPLWQFAPSKLLHAQKIAGAIFNREATRRAKCMDALGKEKVTIQHNPSLKKYKISQNKA